MNIKTATTKLELAKAINSGLDDLNIKGLHIAEVFVQEKSLKLALHRFSKWQESNWQNEYIYKQLVALYEAAINRLREIDNA